MKRLLKRTKLKTEWESRFCRWQIKLSVGSGRYIQPINQSRLYSTNQHCWLLQSFKNTQLINIIFNQSTNHGYVQPINIVDSRTVGKSQRYQGLGSLNSTNQPIKVIFNQSTLLTLAISSSAGDSLWKHNWNCLGTHFVIWPLQRKSF